MAAGEMEPPECPVCLQSYDSDDAIPRVLACGHSVCQICLTHLPRPSSSSLSHTIRCPECTQLVYYPHLQGPIALPKNIDLLRFSLSSSSPKPHQKPLLISPPRRRFRFPPGIWSDELYKGWKDWVLPNGAVLVEEGRIRVSSCLNVIMGCLLMEGQKVSLVEIGRFRLVEPLLEYSYVGKVMRVLDCMTDTKRTELGSLLRVSLRNPRICNVFGLWFDEERGSLCLVVERKIDGLLNSGKEIEDWLSYVETIGIELCEALIGLQSEGLVCGCLGLSCVSFDEFGHLYTDPSEVLLMGRKIREYVAEGLSESSDVEELIVNVSNMDVFVSPEVVLELLRREGVEIGNNDMGYAVHYSSDVWLLACILLRLLIGKQFGEGMFSYLRACFEAKNGGVSECRIMYTNWVKTINSMLETLDSSCSSSLEEILLKCLDFEPASRPLVTEVWKSIRGSSIYHHINNVSSLNEAFVKENAGQCLVLGELCNMSNDLNKEPRISKLNGEHDDCEVDLGLDGEVRAKDVFEGLSSGKVVCKDLQGHLDCITGLCFGGGFLFSSSFDKTINVWSLQDFTHVHTFRGHEHRVMAVVFIDQEKPLCISADIGGGIFLWEVIVPFGQEPLKKWCEEKDWRYSGIHALAVSESGCLYTGSGDRLIKAWSLKDYTHLCSMEGHKSVVSTLALFNGVLYSGSWDGTVRLWSLHDHSPLAVFGEDMPGTVSSVLSLHADQNVVIAAHENGYVKIWMNDAIKASLKVHSGAIFALSMEEKWLFTGGWDKTVKVQEISGDGLGVDTREIGSIACDSVITALLHVQGILFVGCANRLIKAYHCGL